MARESVKILQGKLDVESLIAQLNAALEMCIRDRVPVVQKTEPLKSFSGCHVL